MVGTPLVWALRVRRGPHTNVTRPPRWSRDEREVRDREPENRTVPLHGRTRPSERVSARRRLQVGAVCRDSESRNRKREDRPYDPRSTFERPDRQSRGCPVTSGRDTHPSAGRRTVSVHGFPTQVRVGDPSESDSRGGVSIRAAVGLRLVRGGSAAPRGYALTLSCPDATGCKPAYRTVLVVQVRESNTYRRRYSRPSPYATATGNSIRIERIYRAEYHYSAPHTTGLRYSRHNDDRRRRRTTVPFGAGPCAERTGTDHQCNRTNESEIGVQSDD